MCTREVLCEAVEAAQLLSVADIATASLMLVVEADARRSLLNADDEFEFGRGLCEAVIVFTAGLMLTFRDSLFCFAGEAEEAGEEGTPTPLALAAPGRAATDEGTEEPTALRLDVDERPAKTRRPTCQFIQFLNMNYLAHLRTNRSKEREMRLRKEN